MPEPPFCDVIGICRSLTHNFKLLNMVVAYLIDFLQTIFFSIRVRRILLLYIAVASTSVMSSTCFWHLSTGMIFFVCSKSICTVQSNWPFQALEGNALRLMQTLRWIKKITSIYFSSLWDANRMRMNYLFILIFKTHLQHLM